ncbi:hypothetical protein C8N35_109144 [Breoghania corrubedonensis]|uniref:Uncharacterized protein n=1 Tax=Breoghania corrubedonensis TaxID=665038 RepID=A0A2T5V510_9HYPH|nr:hypothetical protein [Breoghania corrubedonensis]PTW58839.1 hypothetical protein C8N35_109144 [Breoghania corrubedonensis]
MTAALSTKARWIGPALAFAGVAAILVVVFALPARSLLDWWILTTVLAPQQVLPLIGLAIALALAGRGVLVGGLVAFALGLTGGLAGEAVLLGFAGGLPDPAGLITPAASIVVGLGLLGPRVLRAGLVPVAALIAGGLCGLFLRLSDPSLRDPAFPIAGAAVVCWIVLAVMLTLRVLRRRWFDVAGRIAGSWLVAIGLMHGGAVIARAVRMEQMPPEPQTQPVSPAARPPDPAVPPGVDPGSFFPDPDTADALPGPARPRGFDPALQP